MIDWTKPIETVPCERNPVPVPCYVIESHSDDAAVAVFINGPWFANVGHIEADNPNHFGNDYWWWPRKETNAAKYAPLPNLRNVATPEHSNQPNTVTMGLTREMHRALVDAGYADLGDYVARWGDGE